MVEQEFKNYEPLPHEVASGAKRKLPHQYVLTKSNQGYDRWIEETGRLDRTRRWYSAASYHRINLALCLSV